MPRFFRPGDAQSLPQGVEFRDMQDGAPGEIGAVDIPRGVAFVSVVLSGAPGLNVISSNENVIANPIPDCADGDNRTVGLRPRDVGTTLIVVSGGLQRWNFLQVTVLEPDPTRAARAAPSQGSGPSGGRTDPEPVAELLGIVDKKFTDDQLQDQKHVVFEVFFAVQVAAILKTYLFAYRALVARKLPVRNAVFLPAHTFEAGYGGRGPNAAIGNWFSVQVLPSGNTKPLYDAFQSRGIASAYGDRDNRMKTGGANPHSGVFNPSFKDATSGKIDVAGMLTAQLDLVYGAPKDASAQPWVVEDVAPFKSVGRALARTDISAQQFGAVIAAAGYAAQGSDSQAAYAGTFAGAYANVRKVLKWFLGGDLAGASESTKKWATDTLADIQKGS
jgi:hypothetical protein